MRKLIVALILLILATPAAAQTNTFAALNLDQVWTGRQQIPIWNYTVATLPPSATAFSVAIVTDSLDGTCLNGGGAAIVLCSYVSGSWTPLGGGGGGGGGGGITGAVQGQPIYGAGGGTAQSVAMELAADTFPGSDICAKIMTAQTSLPATGGVIRLSAQNYGTCAASIIISKKNVTLRGAGGIGNWGLNEASTVLTFAPGVSGIVGTGTEGMNVENIYIKSASTVAGTDDGITLVGGSPRLFRVIVQGFGRNGIVVQNNTDFWRFENVYSDSNKNDGFYWAPSCSDENAGMASIVSATRNGGYGYELQCGGANNFHTTHAAANTGGAWYVNIGYNYFFDTYVENDGHSAFTFASNANYNTAFFNAFGQPTPLTDNGILNTNSIYYEGAGGGEGNYPAQTVLSLTGKPQNFPGAFYTWYADSGTWGTSDLTFRDRKNGQNIWYYVPTKGWTFIKPLFVGDDSGLSGPPIAGTITIANNTAIGSHTVINTQASGATLFSLPANNGTNGQSLTTDGTGKTSWTTITGGTGAVSSVTGTGTVSCSPTTGAVICNGTSTAGGITNSAGANVVMKSDGTNAIASSVTDNGVSIVTAEPLTAATLTTGSGANGCPASGCWSLSEASAAGTPAAGYDYCRADSTTHGLLCSFNGAAEAPLGGGTGGSPPFSSVTAGTNTAALVMGTGGSLTTSGSGTITATGLSGTPALPNGTTATTQTVGDNSTKVATTAFVLANAGSGGGTCNPTDRTQLCVVEEFLGGTATSGQIGTHGWLLSTIGVAGTVSGIAGTWPHIGILSLNTGATAAQGQGESINLGLVSTVSGDLKDNTNWTMQGIFQLQDITTSVFRIGMLSTANVPRPSTAIALRYDVNSPLSSQSITSIVCTTTACTVTNAGGTLNIPGQDMTISGATCSSRTVNGTQHMTVLSSGTTWQFASAGSNETCSVPGTVSSVAETNFKFYVQNGNTATAAVVDSGVAADTNWHALQIQSTVAGTVVFTLDSGSPVSISTNVPPGGMAMTADLCTDVTLTTAKSVYLDRMVFYMTGLTR